MKSNFKFKKLLSVFTFLIFFMNLFTPTAVFAAENSKNTGTITLSIERRVLGESDILKPTKENITVGEKASIAIDKILKNLKIEYKSTGTLDKNFYISGIKTPEGDFLSEFDHGSVSGWKYSVNGVYPNVGMSDYTLKNGDVVRLQYTAKDMGEDILVVDKIDKLRSKLNEAEKISKDKYTEESFKKLQDEITTVKKEIPTNEQIGQMMSVELGNGDCDTKAYGEKMDKLLNGLEASIKGLVVKKEEVVVPDVKPSFDLDMFSNWDQPNPNTVYLAEGQKSIWARVVRLGSPSLKPVLFDGKEVPVKGEYGLINITPGIHELSVIRWGNRYPISITCKTLPYKIEGNPVPGGTVTVDFNGMVEEAMKNGSTYQLKETTLEFNTNIPGLKTVSSETLKGAPVDREKLSKVTFKIPNDTEPGEYQLTNGGIRQSWGGLSYGRDFFKGKFSVFPTINLKVNPKIDLSKAYSLDLSKWSKFDKVYTLEDSALLKLEGVKASSKVLLNGQEVSPIGDVYAVKMPVGENNLSVDGKTYKIVCKKISYSISNENAIVPGSEVTVRFNGLEESFSYIPGEYNSQELKTVYTTNLKGLEKVSSKSAGSHTYVDRNKLNTVTFKIPNDAKPGTYTMSNGSIYQWWYGNDINGATEKNWAYEKNFSILPNISFKVRDSIPQDKEAPSISANLTDNSTVSKGKLSFRVVVSDNVDSTIIPVVKLNGKELEVSKLGEYTVDLNEGANKIDIEATDNAGNKSTKSYTINYKVKLRPGAGIIVDSLNLVLESGKTHQIIAVDSPDVRSNENDETARMTYSVVKGNDVIKVSKTGLITALKPGVAEVSVRYPGLETPALISVYVTGENKGIGPKITTSIKENKYDTLYYTGDNYDYSFTVDSSDAHINVLFNNKEVIKDNQGRYNIKLKEGYNVVSITASKGDKTSYESYTLKAKKLGINISNLTNPGKAIVQGDKVKISFSGLETPVPKFLRVYNPKRTRVEYKTDMPGATNIYGAASQYNIATKNAIEFTASTAGTFNFTGGNIEESWWGDKLFSEREIAGEGPNLNADVREGNFSSLPNFKLEVLENKNYKNPYTAEILNKEPIKAGDEVTLKINNLEMPDKNAGQIIEAETIFNTNIPGLNEIKSEDGAKDSKNLQTIKFKIPEGTKAGTYTITNGRVFKEWQPSILYVDSEFYKGELPVIKLVVTGNEVKPDVKPEPPVVKPDVKPEKPEVKPDNKPVDVVNPSKSLDEALKSAINWTVSNVKNPTFGNEWDILGLVRSGMFNDKAYLNTYYNNLVNVVKEKKGNLTRNKYTEYSRTIIALTALGKDPKNVGGYNLVEKLYNYKNVSKQGLNGVIFALIALDTNNYEIPKDATNSREKMIDTILKAQLKDGGFALSGNIGNVDLTGMAIQALSKYKNQENVKASIDKALDFLSKAQLNDGGYMSDSVKNVEASVQTLVGLTSLGINPKSKEFVKGKNWIVADIISFMNNDGGFKHSLGETSSNDMATEQAMYGLAAYKRYLENKTPLYDMSDVVIDNNSGNTEDGNNSGNNGEAIKPDNSGNTVKPDSSENTGDVVKPDNSGNNSDNNSGNTSNSGSSSNSGALRPNNNVSSSNGVSSNNGTSSNTNIKPSHNNVVNNGVSSNGNGSILLSENGNASLNGNNKVNNKVSYSNNKVSSNEGKETKASNLKAENKEANEENAKVDESNKEASNGVNTINNSDNNEKENGATNTITGNQKQPLSNFQVVLITLACVCVLLVLKELIVRQYKKKKEAK